MSENVNVKAFQNHVLWLNLYRVIKIEVCTQ